MKWVNKGHELDSVAAKIQSFKKTVIFGAGKEGERVYGVLKDEIEVVGFIDNSIDKQNNGYCGLRVSSAECASQLVDGTTVVVIAVYDKCEVEVIVEIMERYGLKYRENLFYMCEFLPVFMWYKKQKLISMQCTLSITERCNLNCKDCCIFTPYLKDPKHIVISELKKDVDLFFNAFDYVYRFNLIGGEPLLYPDLKELLVYILENYGNKIGKLSLTTNATINLSNEILETIKKYGVFVSASDYLQTLPAVEDSVKRFIKNISEYGIEYEILKSNNRWVDMGRSGEHLNKSSDEKMVEWFDDCAMPCHLLKNGKYYFCQDDGFAFEAGFVKEDSGFPLEKFHENSKVFLLEYSLGYSTKGYVELCRKCNGMPPKNKNYIPAAIQLKRE